LTDWSGFFRRNRGLKLLSLLLALILWFMVGGGERSQTTVSLALELANLPSNMVLVSEAPPSLQVRVTGPQNIIRNLSQDRLSYTLDLSGLTPGPHTFPLGPNSLSFPRGVIVTWVQPNPLSLTLAPAVTRTLEIHPVIKGRPPEGLEVAKVEIKPDKVSVKGPQPELADLKFLPTLPIDVSRLAASASLPTDLEFKNLHLTLLEKTPIVAQITIQPKEASRAISGVRVVPQPNTAPLTPNRVTVTVKGPGAQTQALKPEDITATVNTRNLKPGPHTLKVAVSLPEGLKLLGTKPPAVKTRISKSR
jgi:YbbR domain-containing protein